MMTLRWTWLGAAACLAFAVPITCTAAEHGSEGPEFRVVERFEGTEVSFELEDDVHSVTVVVAGPHRFHARAFSKKGAPVLDLKDHGKVGDGSYKYEVTAALAETIPLVNDRLADGPLGTAPKFVHRGVMASGVFRVEDGRIVALDQTPESERESDRDED